VRPGPARVHVRTAPTSVAARRALVASGPVHRRFGDRYRPSHEPAVAAAAAPGRRSECPRSAPTMKGRPTHFRGRRATFRSQLQLLLLLLLLLLVPRPGNRPIRLRILTVPATATARPGSKSRRNRRSSDADRGRRVRCDRDHAFLIVVPARGHALSGDGAGRRFAGSPIRPRRRGPECSSLSAGGASLYQERSDPGSWMSGVTRVHPSTRSRSAPAPTSGFRSDWRHIDEIFKCS
jgi:hypothetical protein